MVRDTKLMNITVWTRTAAAIACSLLGSLCWAQQRLSLLDAILLAKKNNGTVQSAFLSVQSARSRVRQAYSGFLPTLTPSASYQSRRTETFTGFRTLSRFSDWSTGIDAGWLLLDSGQRDWRYRASRRQLTAEEAGARQTVRDVLFSVQVQFLDALKAQELRRVAQAQVTRAEAIKKQTDLQAEVGTAPKKDKLQAEADLLNAKVSLLQADNATATTFAQLKATIGWDKAEEQPELLPVEEPKAFAELEPLDALISEGLAANPTLVELRARVQAQQYNVAIAERDASLSWTLDAAYSRSFSPDVSDDRRLTFLASFPLFDGSFARERARESKLSLESLRIGLLQAERQARADIESAYKVLRQDVERVEAARAAREAARINFDAASKAHALGAEGTTIITVLTAQVSLVTAESNYVEAIYDYYVSEARLRLAVGRPLPGEDLP